MSVKAKCHNYTGCLLAYRGEEVDIASGAPLVCPECGKPMTAVQSKGGAVGRALGFVILLGAVGAGLYFGIPYISKKDGLSDTPPTPAPTTPGPTATPNTKSPSATPAISSAPAVPVAKPSVPEKIDLNLSSEVNRAVREDVLKRIDLMPNVSQANKDKLYNSVQRARSMGMIVTIPFAAGATRLTPTEVQMLKNELEKAEPRRLRDDATAVFVILGYADPKGDEKKNLQISQLRADLVLEAMREKCGVENVMHAVAMGGSTLLDQENVEKNRVVEVWAVLP